MMLKNRRVLGPLFEGTLTRGASNWIPVLIGATALVGLLVVGYSTALGPNANSDSVAYVAVSRNFLQGRGFGILQASGQFVPQAHTPPLFPLALASAGWIGADQIQAARWLNALFFAVVIFMAGWMVYRASGSRWIGLAAAGLILTFPPLMENSSGILSEPMFLAAGMASVLALVYYFPDSDRKMLVISALFAALALLTRYAGAAYIAAGTLAVLVLGDRDLKRRLTDTIVITVVAIVPGILWLLWIEAQPNSEPARVWIWKFSNLWDRTEALRGAFVDLGWNWVPLLSVIFEPTYRWKLASLIIVAVAVATVFGFVSYKIFRDPHISLRRSLTAKAVILLLLVGGSHIGLLTITFLFSLPALDQADINERLVLPAAVMILLASLMIAMLVGSAWPRLQALPYVLALLGLAWFLPQSVDAVESLHNNAFGFTGPAWRQSETIQAARALPQETILISNESAAIMFYLDQAAYDIPELMPGGARSESVRFGEGRSGEERIFREEGAALILFDSVTRQFESIYPGQGQTRSELLNQGLIPFAELSDGTIYFYPDREP